MIIGITGNSGSGKTTISNLLKKEFSAEVIDADLVVKEMSVSGTEYFNQIVSTFGKNILLENGELNKSKLAKIVFNDISEREKLNNHTFKYVVDEIKNRVRLCKSDMIIIDAPLLIESKLDKICNIVISVIADNDIKVKRISKRDKIDEKNAKLRIESQPDEMFYKRNSNFVIVNNNSDLEKDLKDIKEVLNSEMIKSKETVIIQSGILRILQFKKLLEYNNTITHAFTLKPLDFGSIYTYKDKKIEIEKNYKLLCNFLNLDSKNVIRPCQTHTKNIREVKDETGIYSQDFKDVDGLVTNKRNRILSLAFADCTPLYLFDKKNKVIGNIHSGWQGTSKSIAKEAIEFMKVKYGSNPKDITCVIGPTIRDCHFEVKEDVKEIFFNNFKYMKDIDDIIKYNKESKSYYIDTVKININLLKEEGLSDENIIDSKICTVCNSKLTHSFRKEGEKSKRSTSLICLK